MAVNAGFLSMARFMGQLSYVCEQLEVSGGHFNCLICSRRNCQAAVTRTCFLFAAEQEQHLQFCK